MTPEEEERRQTARKRLAEIVNQALQDLAVPGASGARSEEALEVAPNKIIIRSQRYLTFWRDAEASVGIELVGGFGPHGMVLKVEPRANVSWGAFTDTAEEAAAHVHEYSELVGKILVHRHRFAYWLRAYGQEIAKEVLETADAGS